MHFLKLSLVFNKCSVLYTNIAVGEVHIVCISQVCTIVDKQSGVKFLNPASNDFIAEQYNTTFATHVVCTIAYPYCIVFDQDTVFMLSYFPS